MELQATVVNKYLEKITDFGFEYVPKLGGILVLFSWVMDFKLITTKRVGKLLEHSSIDISLYRF
jgi:small conductance mechanosensitive channel